MSAARRVVLSGSECTGKTTLCAELAAHFGAPWSREAARAYAERVGRALDAADVEAIARAQIEGEDEARAAAGRVVLGDTDLVSTVVYARHYYGACPDWIEAAAFARRADLYLLLHPDVPWRADGVRDRAARRSELHALFEDVLARLNVPVVAIRGTWTARRTRAVAAVCGLLAPEVESRAALR